MTFPTSYIGIIRNHYKDPVIKQPGFSGKLFFCVAHFTIFQHGLDMSKRICKPNNLSEKSMRTLGLMEDLRSSGGYPGSKSHVFSSRHFFWQLFSCCYTLED